MFLVLMQSKEKRKYNWEFRKDVTLQTGFIIKANVTFCSLLNKLLWSERNPV